VTTRRAIRIWLVIFIVGLVISGLTAFPLEAELRLAASILHGTVFGGWMPQLTDWIDRVRDAVIATNQRYPFIAYGTDWLAFAHLVIAIAFVGVFRDPVRNIWIIVWGMIACVAVIPLALIAGPIRGIPWGWTLLDCSFGVVGIVPLVIVYRLIRRLEREQPVTPSTPPAAPE
jgi:hypothetical protein